MNREETKQAIAVMQAYVDGEEIKVLCKSGVWLPAGDPCWDWKSYRYSVKQKPREYWVVLDSSGIGGMLTYTNKRQAEELVNTNVGAQLVHVREVEK